MTSPKPKCPACGHTGHTSPCRRRGRVECRPLQTEHGTLLVRGTWPCGCEHTPDPAPPDAVLFTTEQVTGGRQP